MNINTPTTITTDTNNSPILFPPKNFCQNIPKKPLCDIKTIKKDKINTHMNKINFKKTKFNIILKTKINIINKRYQCLLIYLNWLFSSLK